MTQTVSIADLMASSGVAFGTSGARGLVGAMTDAVCFAYTCAFLQHLGIAGQFEIGTTVAIAGDLRPSTPRILAACTAAVQHMGGAVAFCGFVPSPALAAYSFAQGIPSMMVTGSHIPEDRNGIKFNRVDGEILKPDEIGIRNQEVTLPDLFDDGGMFKVSQSCGPLIDVTTGYVGRYVDFFGKKALQGLKLGIYEHSAVGRDVLAVIVDKLGGEVIRLGRSKRFIPVDTEAVRPEDQVLAQQWVTEFGLDAILSTDGDSDRPLLADETGAWIRGDVLGILTAQALGIKAVAAPVSCNTALELSQAFTAIRRTRIGSPYVIDAMNALIGDGTTAVCGYEANGGFLLATQVEAGGCRLAALPTRDAVLPMVAVLVDAQRKRLTLSGLLAQLPARYTFSDRIKNYSNDRSQALLVQLQNGSQEQIYTRLTKLFWKIAGNAVAYDATDGLRVSFDSGDIIHLRPSGNAPELRCYTESATLERAISINEQVFSVVLNRN